MVQVYLWAVLIYKTDIQFLKTQKTMKVLHFIKYAGVIT